MINLSLPLSATALRLGSAFLSDLAAQSDVIQSDLRGPSAPGLMAYEVSLDANLTQQKMQESALAVSDSQLQVAEETPEQRQYRLHGNVASGGMEPAPVAAPNPVLYETVVIGHERNPEYAGSNAAFEQGALEAAGWTTELLLADGYLREVTEYRPLPVAPGASSPAPAPAAAPAAASGSMVPVDKAGQPYDPRIHAKSDIPLTKEGYWKTKKNLPEGYKEQIEAELRQVMAASPSTATTENASAPAPSPAAPPAPVAAPPAPAPAAAPAAPSPAPAANGAMTFAEFTRYLVANKVDQGKVMVQVQKVGLKSIPDLAKRPDLIPAVVEGLKG